MPIYAYRCSACGHAQDVLQKISDPLLTVCPACGQAAYAKQVTAAGFQLKGSGWYVTDFRDSGKAAKAGADKGADTGAGKAADTAGDKPAAGSGASGGDKGATDGGKKEAASSAPSSAPSPAAPTAGS